ncbi:MAG: efflux RND transporter permease subunit [Bacteroidales bacterium]|nr:efflux RND transporter permease subunit [Bacteroidales bacterium]
MAKSVVRSAVEFSVKHKSIIILIVVFMALFGVYALTQMPKQEFPQFSIRQGLVVGVYPGATSDQVEEQLTKPLEEFLFSYKEVNKTLTYSVTSDGMVVVYVQLSDQVQTSDDEFWSKFRLDAENFKSSLPSGVAGIFTSNDFGSTSALLISIESKEKTYRELEGYLSELESRLRTIPSVSNLRRYGIQNEQITVYVDKQKLVQYGIDATMLTGTLFAQNFTTISGSYEDDEHLAPFHVSETYESENDVAEQIVYVDPTGSVVRLKDIARIEREYPRPTSYIANGDKKCVMLSIEMMDGNNIVEYGKDVKAVLDDFEETLPPEVTVFRVADQAEVVSHSVNMFMREMLIAIITVILVIVLMQPMRVAGISAMTIPITMFIALGIMYLVGFEINTVTLGALLVVLGIIVDDSVVVIDNYVEKLDHGVPRLEATLSSGTELFKSVLSATLAITITFYPLLFTCTGLFGEFLGSFPGTITITLFTSLVISMLFIPFVQYDFIKKGFHAPTAKKRKFNIPDKIQSLFDKIISVAFRLPKVTILLTVLAVAAGVLIFLQIPQRMMPSTERNQFVVEIYLPNSSSLSRTEKVCDSLSDILRKDKRIKNVTSFVGCSAPRFHMCYAPKFPSKHYAQLIITTTTEKMTNVLLDEYEDRYVNYFPDAYVRFKQLDYVVTAFPVEIDVSGESPESVRAAARKIADTLRQRKDLLFVTTSEDEMTTGVNIDVNNLEANRLGVTKPTIMTNLAFDYGDGLPVTTLWEGDYPVKVVLKSDKDSVGTFENISDEYISSLSGSAVPLRQIADIKEDYSSGQIYHKNGIFTVTVQADVKRNVNVTGTTRKIDKSLSNMELPDDIHLKWGGARLQDDTLMPQIFKGLAFAVLVIFMILVFHFRSLKLAILILGATLLSIFGAALGIQLMRMSFTLTSVLGLVALMGIIVRNGIIMYDYAEALRLKGGLSAHDAALEAGKRRMRPIFLTSAAASMGVVPMIISNSALWSPMGVVICFGTWISMVFVITVLPVLYWVANIREDQKRKEFHLGNKSE